MSNTKGWFIDDDLVHRPLKALGYEVKNVPWDQPADWNAFDVVVIRSTWDYQDHLDRFMQVLHSIEASSAVLVNCFDIVNWNIQKDYLFDLEKKGVELVPTMKCQGVQKSYLERAFEQFETDEIIIKPILGANAYDTFSIHRKDTALIKQIVPLFEKRRCMIQPFMQHIKDEGEYALTYLEGAYSHAVLKTVAPGDYRVQEEHGGGIQAIKSPEKLLLNAGNNVIHTLNRTPLYARVDLVRTPGNTFALMELELVEPSLYLRFDINAPGRFASSIDRYWKEHIV